MWEHLKTVLPKVICPTCGAKMELRITTKFRYGNNDPRKFWGCSRYPKCKSTHGAHPDGRPLGTPANVKTKEARMRAHVEFDRLWKGGAMTRTEAYVVMREVMGITQEEAHIGKFTTEQCEQLIARLKEREDALGSEKLLPEDGPPPVPIVPEE